MSHSLAPGVAHQCEPSGPSGGDSLDGERYHLRMIPYQQLADVLAAWRQERGEEASPVPVSPVPDNIEELEGDDDDGMPENEVGVHAILDVADDPDAV